MTGLLQPLPQWSSIALQPPQELVQVKLRTAVGETDVTGNNVVAALRPLTLAMGLDPALIGALPPGAVCELHFIDSQDGATLGVLQLQRQEDWSAAGMALSLFAVTHGRHQCLAWPRRPWNRWLQDRAVRAGAKPGNFALSLDATQQIMIFYICPRPVVLVSVESGCHSNLFPMDLIGPVGSTQPDASQPFTLALRSSSASVEAMKEVRRVALSDVPAAQHRTAYSLGAHHKNAQFDREDLPFRLDRSPRFSLPVPEWALRVRELEIVDVRTVGSHTLFMTQIQSERTIGPGAQFFHTSGIHQCYRQRRRPVWQLAP